MKRYEQYKSSGIEWLGEVPEKWDLERLKFSTKTITGYAFSSDDYNDFGIPLIRIGDISENGKINIEDSKKLPLDFLDRFEFVRIDKDDILMAMTGATIGKTGRFNHKEPGLLNQRVCKFVNEYINSTFFWYILKSYQYSEHIKLTCIGGAQANISDIQLLDFIASIPPLPEQKAISEYLDEKTILIVELIQKKEGLIDLLQEERTAVISHVVTKGLDPDAPMKPSGEDWLGEVPMHWETRRLKKNFDLITTKAENKANPIALENIESWTGSFIETETNFLGDGIAFIKNDILFGKLRPYLAKVFKTDENGEAIGDFYVLRPNENIIDPAFASFLLRSRDFIDVVNGSTLGAKMPRVSWGFMGNMVTPLPPLSEQQEIAEYLDKKTVQIDSLIGITKKEIEKLKEYRQTLISQVVTGKIKVCD